MRDPLADIAGFRATAAREHGETQADRIVAVALLGACELVYAEACRRTSIAEDALHVAIAAHDAARATQDEWRCILHGQALTVGKYLDADRPRVLEDDANLISRT